MKDVLPNIDKNFLDITSVGITIGTLLSVLPHIAAVLTILWTAIRIYETETIQTILGRKKDVPKQD